MLTLILLGGATRDSIAQVGADYDALSDRELAAPGGRIAVVGEARDDDGYDTSVAP